MHAHEAVVRGLLAQPRGERFAARLLRLVDAFEHHHLGAVDRAVGMLAAGEARLPGQRRVAGRVDEAGRRKLHVAIAGGELELAHLAAVARHAAQDGAEQHGDAGLAHGFLDPARQRDLVIHHHGGVRRPAAAIVQRVLGAEVAQDVVGNPVGELVSVRAVGEQAAERADDRVDGLAAERGQPIDQRDLAAEPRRLERRRDAGDAGSQDADIRRYLPRRCRAAGRRTIRVAVESFFALSALMAGRCARRSIGSQNIDQFVGRGTGDRRADRPDRECQPNTTETWIWPRRCAGSPPTPRWRDGAP